MSAAMVVNTGMMRHPIIHDTMVNAPKDIQEKHLAGMITKTTGVPLGKAVMHGVLERTVPENRKDAPELRKVPKDEVGKTQTRISYGVPYAGPKMGKHRK